MASPPLSDLGRGRSAGRSVGLEGASIVQLKYQSSEFDFPNREGGKAAKAMAAKAIAAARKIINGGGRGAE